MQSNINELIIKKLNDLGLTISTCESMTGGAVASNLVLVEHASKSFLGSLVTYHANAKMKLAKVDWELINKHGTATDLKNAKVYLASNNAYNSINH